MEQTLSLDQQAIASKQSIKQYIERSLELPLFLLIFGNVFFMMFPYFVGRFVFAGYLQYLLIFVYIIMQLTGIEKFKQNKEILFIYFCFTCLLFWELLSYLFLSQHEKAQGFLTHKMMSFCLFYVFSQYLSTEKRVSMFLKILVICILWNVGICLWEIFTVKHFPMSRMYDRVSIIPTGAFYNENDLSQLLLITIPVLFFSKNKILSHLCNLLLLIIFIITIIAGARLSLLAMFPIIIIHFITKTTIWYKIVIIAAITISINQFLISNPEILNIVKLHIEKNVLSFSFETETMRTSSIKERMNMIVLQIEEFANSGGIGVGLANYEYSTMYTRRYWDNGTLFAHNFLFQTLCDEGIIGFLLSIIIFFSLLKYNITCRVNDVRHHFWNVLAWNKMEMQIVLYLFFFSTSGILGSLFSHHFFIISAYYYSLVERS